MALKDIFETKSPFEELKLTLIAYVKQETLGPLKKLARYLAFGLAGAFALVLGANLILLGVLRLLQSETGSFFTGSLTWLPYLIVAVVGAVMAVSSIGAAKRKASAKELIS